MNNFAVARHCSRTLSGNYTGKRCAGADLSADPSDGYCAGWAVRERAGSAADELLQASAGVGYFFGIGIGAAGSLDTAGTPESGKGKGESPKFRPAAGITEKRSGCCMTQENTSGDVRSAAQE